MNEINYEIFIKGFLLQASLILVLGAQNLFIIDIGLKRNYQYLAATVCACCDTLLIGLGVFGVATFLAQSPIFKMVISLLGAGFLIYYAILKLKKAFAKTTDQQKKISQRMSKKKVIVATLSFTLLNPHVYLDTFILIGGFSIQYQSMSNKLIFALGASSFSALWFYGLTLFSSKFNRILNNRKSEKAMTTITSLILIYLAFNLLWFSVKSA